MHRPKSNTSLDERALTEAAKPHCLDSTERGEPQPCHMCIERARSYVTAYLAALPEPPPDEWLSGLRSLHAIVGAIETSSKQRPLPLAQRIQRALLEALAEHRSKS